MISAIAHVDNITFDKEACVAWVHIESPLLQSLPLLDITLDAVDATTEQLRDAIKDATCVFIEQYGNTVLTHDNVIIEPQFI